MVKLSVVMVSKNSEKCIGRAIKSLESQTFKDFEVIFIDAVSTDNTLKIIKKTKLPKVVISEKDNGIYDAMNKGVRYASGQFVYFLNTDDIVSDALVFERAMKYCNKDMLLLHGSTSVLSHGKVKDYFFALNEENLKNGSFPAMQCIFYRRHFLAGMRGFNSSFKLAGDFDLLCRINKFLAGSKGRIIELPFSVGFLTPGGASAVGNLGGIELGRVIKQYFGEAAFLNWWFPKFTRSIGRNVLINVGMIDWYRAKVGKNVAS